MNLVVKVRARAAARCGISLRCCVWCSMIFTSSWSFGPNCLRLRKRHNAHVTVKKSVNLHPYTHYTAPITSITLTHNHIQTKPDTEGSQLRVRHPTTHLDVGSIAR